MYKPLGYVDFCKLQWSNLMVFVAFIFSSLSRLTCKVEFFIDLERKAAFRWGGISEFISLNLTKAQQK
jgi:hypothetical protein